MPVKYDLNFNLKIQDRDMQEVVVVPPQSIEFSVSQSTNSSSKMVTIVVYNLSREVSESLRKDINDTNVIRECSLSVGYGSNFELIVRFNLVAVIVSKLGIDNTVTITGWDNNNVGTLKLEHKRGAGIKDSIIKTIEGSDYDVGTISEYTGTLDKDLVFLGDNVLEFLNNELTNNDCYITDKAISCVLDTDTDVVTASRIKTISSENGLLNISDHSGFRAVVETMFEPSVKVGDQINLQSDAREVLNGSWDVVGLSHQGNIRRGGESRVVTSFSLHSPEIERVVGRGRA